MKKEHLMIICTHLKTKLKMFKEDYGEKMGKCQDQATYEEHLNKLVE